jgi:hypothetical protein
MDISDDHVLVIPRSNTRHRMLVAADESHPFDLEGYISNYSGLPSRLVSDLVFTLPKGELRSTDYCIS